MRPPLTAKKVFDSARRGDRAAKRTVADEATWIALVIAAVVSVADPELVILGGGIGANGDLLLDPIERELATISPFRPRIEVSALREEATLSGAVWMALQAAQDRLFDRREVPA
jgi:predicted NBD/HSP70 family sugar kinase